MKIAVCRRLGCLPLALILTGSWLAEHERTLEGLIRALGQEGISTTALEPNLLDPRLKIKQGLDAAIAVSWQSISDDVQQLGRVLSLFAAADLPWELVAGTIDIYGDRPTPAPTKLNWWQRLWRWLCGWVGIGFPQPLVNLPLSTINNPQEAKFTLRRSSLLQLLQEKVYRLHPLLHEFMGQQWAEYDRDGWREAMLKSLSDQAAKVPKEPTWEDAQNYQIFVPHFQHGRQEVDLLLQQATTPDQKKFYRSQKGSLDGGVFRLNIALVVETTYQNAKRAADRAKAASALDDQQAAAKFFAQAIEGYERAIDQAKQALPPNGMLLAGYLLKIAEAFRALSKYKKGISLAEEAVRIAEAKAKPVQLAKYLDMLAMIHHDQGNYSEAESLYGRSLQIRETQLGADHPDTAQSMNNLAGLYYSMGRYSDAEPLFVRSLQIRETQRKAGHPSIAQSLDNLATLYQAMGRYSEAEPLYLRSLQIWETQLGADRSDTAICLDNLAALYESQGRYSDAEPLCRQSLQIWETQLGANHPDTAICLNNLAILYASQGRYTDAEPLYKRSLQIKETQLGTDHPSTSASLHNLAGLYKSMGRYSDAEPLYLRALDICTKSLGENHPNTQMAWSNFRYLLQQALANKSADTLSSHPLTQQLLQEMRK